MRIASLATALLISTGAQAQIQLERLNMPPGFKLEVFAEDVGNARAMTQAAGGTLLVGSRKAGRVYAVVDEDGDFRADQVIEIDRDLNQPVGVAMLGDDLYVSATTSILRYPDIEANLQDPPEPDIIYSGYPNRHHGWKFIAFGPDGKLYVPVGAPCNICDEPGFNTITRINPDGSGREDYALGVRNSVGFAWHPQTGELWFTDNGRDHMGDDIPPDELNRVSRQGEHFGYPFCHGGDISDPEFGDQRPCSDFTAPVQRLGPHVASLGMIFYTGSMFPAEYQNQVLIAEHGSWNRSEKIGYRITLVTLDGNQATDYRPLIDGWHEGDDVWGRPVDLHQLADGSVLISDDYANAIYRLTYQAP